MKQANVKIIYWASLKYNDWNLYMAATEKGLCFVGSQNGTFAELLKWAEKRFSTCTFLEAEDKLQLYKVEVSEYLDGKRTDFSIAFDFAGTPFQLAVWDALCQIPYGETRIYSDIAHTIEKPAAVRAVGAAIGANPLLIIVPCHRVIGKNGKLTGYRGGLEMKTELLKLERTIYKSKTVVI